MIHKIKPGYVLRFEKCPKKIISPAGVESVGMNNITLETQWPPKSSKLGMVTCLSHPSGSIGSIAADVATHLRTTPGSISRLASYSGAGRAFTESNRVIGKLNCDFVGYADGRSYYIQSDKTVFSKDFSGCLMVEYFVRGQRRVAHVAASKIKGLDCKQAFLTTRKVEKAELKHGWFKPFDATTDSARKIKAFNMIKKYIQSQINDLVTFGVVTAMGEPYSIDAFKPRGLTENENDWIVTDVRQKVMSQSWIVPKPK